MKKAVGYMKRSGDKRDEFRQFQAVESYCKVNGLELTEWLDYADFGDVVYGNWKGHQKIDAVVVATNMDVTARAFDFYAYRCRLEMRGMQLVITEWQDYPGYRAYRNVLEEFAKTLCRMELEHEPIRNADGRKRKVSKGQYIGGNAPMGYKVVDGTLKVNRKEVPVVKLIMEEKHAGRTMLGTMEKLNAEGYRNRRGGKFTIGTVQGIWNNEEFYKGYYKVKDTEEWIKGAHEAILCE